MIEHVEYYQFGFYAPNTHIEPEPNIIGRLLEAFKSKGFIPSTAHELGIQIGPNVNQAAKTRLQLQFISPSGEWNLAFELNRVLLKRMSLNGMGIGTPEDFRKEAKEVFGILLNVNQFIGSRLSYAMKGLLPEMAAAKLVEANSRVINPLPFYKKNPPHQWTTRNLVEVNVKLGSDTEILNVITDINRIQGQLTTKTEPLPIDRIQIGLDISTHQGNTNLRFNDGHVDLFLQEAMKKSQEIMDEIKGKLNG